MTLNRFPKVQTLRGELKRSEIRSGVRYQLTTEEFILQRSHRTYRIALRNILGLVECQEDEFRGAWVRSGVLESGGHPYKIVATLLYLISPAGVIEQNSVSLYTRLSPPFAKQLSHLLQTTIR
ncbi:hypothetical protein [Alicyclobacillus sp. ALC3]|uniref:hypothetical protein n=1 Tax=Alicyclobacillus sp. ALC3 TaxID=2796143 RepID=UPI0023790CE5|nr:hypothetical protein [Alicyclobacillus sp. ALC3]